MKLRFRLFLSAVVLIGGSCFLALPYAEARVLHVDTRVGDDRNTGGNDAPLRTIARAIRLAEAGDEILLVPGQSPVHEEIKIDARSGASGLPITFDGGGNTLDGSRRVIADEWEKVGPGLYRKSNFEGFVPRGESSKAMLRRFYFSFDGKVQRMGRAGKGANAPLPAPEKLLEGEWTYVEAEKAFYLSINPEKNLAEVAILYPYLLNGVATRGECRHWVIRNLAVRHFLNDGFNLHGTTADFRLEQISALECGDDGLSAHGRCEFEVHGFTASGNTTGICHVGSSRGSHSLLHLDGNVTYNLCLLGDGAYTIRDSVVGARDGTVRFGSKGKGGLRVHLERVEIQWPEGRESALRSKAFELHPGVELSTSGMPALPHEE